MHNFLFLLYCTLLVLAGWSHQRTAQIQPSAMEDIQQTVVDGTTCFLLQSENDLAAIGQTCPLSGNYCLSQDITLSGEWVPIGSEGHPFTGTFDDNGFTIYGLTVTQRADSMGFFADCDGAVIRNLVLEDADIDVLSFFPIAAHAVDTEIIDCSVNAGSQAASDAASVCTAEDAQAWVEPLMAENWQEMPLCDFSTLALNTFGSVETMQDTIQDLSGYYTEDSPEADFVNCTLPAVCSILNSGENQGVLSASLLRERTAGRVLMDTLEFNWQADYDCRFALADPAVTVGALSDSLQQFHQLMLQFVDGCSEEALQSSDIGQTLSDQMNRIAAALNSPDIQLSPTLTSVQLLDTDGNYQNIW